VNLSEPCHAGEHQAPQKLTLIVNKQSACAQSVVCAERTHHETCRAAEHESIALAEGEAKAHMGNVAIATALIRVSTGHKLLQDVTDVASRLGECASRYACTAPVDSCTVLCHLPPVWHCLCAPLCHCACAGLGCHSACKSLGRHNTPLCEDFELLKHMCSV
jgi:hypothetical protein